MKTVSKSQQAYYKHQDIPSRIESSSWRYGKFQATTNKIKKKKAQKQKCGARRERSVQHFQIRQSQKKQKQKPKAVRYQQNLEF